MENYPAKIVSEIGLYDELEDSYFNLAPYAYISQSLFPIQKVVLYLSELSKDIIGIELYYIGYSTGIYQGFGYKVNHNNKIVIDMSNNNKSDDSFISIHGSYIGNRITQLIFSFKSSREEGFNSSIDYNKNQLNHFAFKTGQLLGFKVAFNNKGLTFLSTIMTEEDKYTLSNRDNETQVVMTKTQLGKPFSDSIEFSLSDDIIKDGTLIKIQLYHDGNLLIGIESTYILNQNDSIRKTVQFGKKTGLYESLDLSQSTNEYIDSITIRSGDMIDGIMLTTTKGNSIISGGIGGGPHHYSLNEISSQYFQSKANMRFIGFEGSGNNVMHTLKLLFK